MKVKFFSTRDIEELEVMINRFLQMTTFSEIDIKYSTNGNGSNGVTVHSAVLIYG